VTKYPSNLNVDICISYRTLSHLALIGKKWEISASLVAEIILSNWIAKECPDIVNILSKINREKKKLIEKELANIPLNESELFPNVLKDEADGV